MKIAALLVIVLTFSLAFAQDSELAIPLTVTQSAQRSRNGLAPSKFPLRITVHASTTRRPTIAQDTYGVSWCTTASWTKALARLRVHRGAPERMRARPSHFPTT